MVLAKHDRSLAQLGYATCLNKRSKEDGGTDHYMRDNRRKPLFSESYESCPTSRASISLLDTEKPWLLTRGSDLRLQLQCVNVHHLEHPFTSYPGLNVKVLDAWRLPRGQ